MSGHWTDKFSFVSGAIRNKEHCFLILQDDGVNPDEIPHSQLVSWKKGKWGGRNLSTSLRHFRRLI
jgi:hypothetical protein